MKTTDRSSGEAQAHNLGVVELPPATARRRLLSPRAAQVAARTALPIGVLAAGLGVTAEHASAAFPGLNGRVACSGRLGTFPPPSGGSSLEIFSINPDASGETRLTENTSTDVFPKYSPDGTKIAFQRNDREVWTMNADGTNQTPLATLGTNSPGSWSPDGTQIVFQTNRDGNTEIYKMNADGSNQVNLTNSPPPAGGPAARGNDTFPAWSPDGTKILWRSDRDGNPNLYTMNQDGSGQTQLTNDPAEESGPAWSPDGKQVAFHTDRDAFGVGRTLNRNLEIYRMNADGSGAATRLTFNDFTGGGGGTIGGTPGADLTGYDLFPAWSPEGDRIVFHSGRAQEFRDTGQTGIVAQWEAYTIDAIKGEGPGGDLRRLTNRAGNDERCDWQALARPVVQPLPGVVSPPGGDTPNPSPPPIRLDTTPPTVTVSGVPSSMSMNAFLKGVTARVTRNEASSIDATLEGSAKKATLAAAFNVSLASRSVARGTGVSSIRLKPSKKLVGRAKKLRARVRVVVTDAAGNRRTVTRVIKVKR